MRDSAPRVLITGAGGLLGGRLALRLSSRLAVVAAWHENPPPPGLHQTHLELLSLPSLSRAIEESRPDAVLHAAAIADVERCEREPEQAERVNTSGSFSLARLCQVRGIRMVALSTDLVFGGRHPFYQESDHPEPLMVYARTKLRGEEAVLAEARGSVVARVALACGPGHGYRGTASEAIAWNLRAGRPMKLFTDQFRTPVDTESVAGALERLLRGTEEGLFHLGGPERLSRHALGLRVARVLGLPQDLVLPATQSEHAEGTPRPADVSLDSGRARAKLGYEPRPLEEAIRAGRQAPDLPPPIP